MSEEKLRVLEMIKDGTISPQEGMEILNALEKASGSEREMVDVSEPSKKREMTVEATIDTGDLRKTIMKRVADKFKQSGESGKKKPRWLKIEVCESGGKVVNIKIPIGLAKFAGKFIPNSAKEEMREQGIDLDLAGIMDMIAEEGPMNFIEVDGDEETVKIYTE